MMNNANGGGDEQQQQQHHHGLGDEQQQQQVVHNLETSITTNHPSNAPITLPPDMYSQQYQHYMAAAYQTAPHHQSSTSSSSSTSVNHLHSPAIYYPPSMPATQQNELNQRWSQLFADLDSPKSFKNHELPLARIKKIMKSDEDVRMRTMISAEAPILFAKACEMFIIELTIRSWIHTEDAKRRTLQRNDIAGAISKTDIFDFLIDIVPREDGKPAKKDPRDMGTALAGSRQLIPPDMSHQQYLYMLQQQHQANYQHMGEGDEEEEDDEEVAAQSQVAQAQSDTDQIAEQDPTLLQQHYLYYQQLQQFQSMTPQMQQIFLQQQAIQQQQLQQQLSTGAEHTGIPYAHEAYAHGYEPPYVDPYSADPNAHPQAYEYQHPYAYPDPQQPQSAQHYTYDPNATSQPDESQPNQQY